MTYQDVIKKIVDLKWDSIDEQQLIYVAWAYYYFSIQFRENLLAACTLYSDDENLTQLKAEECNTDNLSPWPGVADKGEPMNHDEFMRRSLLLSLIDTEKKARLEAIGHAYLEKVRPIDDEIKAMSIASYEDGGLEAIFSALLTAQFTDNPTLRAFRHFLEKHIEFDSNPDEGHGALSRHIRPDDRITPLWEAFYVLFVDAVPDLK